MANNDLPSTGGTSRPQRENKMSKDITTPKLRKVEHSRSQAAVGKRPPGLQVCNKCHAIYLKKHWQWDYPLYEKYKDDKTIVVTCPACNLKRREDAEGILYLSGFASSEQREEIINLLRNADRRANERDPQDRVYIWDTGDLEVSLYITENQLALSLGRQVRSAFGGKLDIATSKEEDIVRVKWVGEEDKKLRE
ncbi:hypothetical protein ACFL0Z_02810 [Patescibacteria group bacterium]